MAELNARIIAKASGTAAEEPLAADLEVAELAVNTADGKLFTKHTDGSVVTISGGGGGGGGAVDSVNGQTGDVILNLDDIGDVNTKVLADSSYKTGFEIGEPYPQDPTPTVDTTIFYEGSRSISFSAASSYGDGSYLENVFPDSNAPRYDVVRLYVRSDAAFDTNNRQSIGGTKEIVGTTGGGWVIYTRDTGFSFYSNGTYVETGTKPSMVADTWYEIVYVLDWANGRDVIPASWSLWVDGAIAVNSFDLTASGVGYTAPAAADRFYWSNSTSAGSATRWVDKLDVKSSETIPWGMSAASIDEANDVTPFFAGSILPTPDGHVLRYDSSAQEWQTVDYSLASLPEANYSFFYVGDDPTKPYGRLSPTSLGSFTFSAYTTKDDERWSIYANSTYGVAIGKYHEEVANGGTIANDRLRDNEARRTYYSDNGIIHNMGDKPLWLMGALSTYTDNTPELRWTSGNPGDSSTTNDGNYIGLKLPAGVTENTTYTFPPAPIDGGRLTTDTDGNLSWDLTGADLAAISDLDDVDTETTAPTDGQALVWSNAEQKWVPGTVSGGGGGGAVDSVNGQTGAVELDVFDLTDVTKANAPGFSGLTTLVEPEVIEQPGQYFVSSSSLYLYNDHPSLSGVQEGDVITLQASDPDSTQFVGTIEEITVRDALTDRWRFLGGLDSVFEGLVDEFGGTILVFGENVIGSTPLPPTPGQALIYSSERVAFVPTDVTTSVNGETGTVSLGIQDMDDYVVPGVGVNSGFNSSFETGETLPDETPPGYSLESSGGVDGGAYVATPSGTGSNNHFAINNVLDTDTAAEVWDVFAIAFRSSVAINTSNRMWLIGNKDQGAFPGWAVYTRLNGLAWHYGSSYQEVGSVAYPLAADTWHTALIQIHWPAGRSGAPNLSAWINGVRAVENITVSATNATASDKWFFSQNSQNIAGFDSLGYISSSQEFISSSAVNIDWDAQLAAIKSSDPTIQNGSTITWDAAAQKYKPAQLPDTIDKATLQSEVAASTDFADFQSRIAAL